MAVPLSPPLNGRGDSSITTRSIVPPTTQPSSRIGRQSLSPSPSTDRFPSGLHGSSSARNPLSLRLYKSLSSKFEDPSSRAALETLSSLYSNELSTAPSTLGPSSVKSQATPHQPDSDGDSDSDNEATSSKAQPEATVESSSIFAQSFIRNAPLGDITIAERARKNSRRDVEKQLIGSSVRFLDAFGDVNDVSFYIFVKVTIEAIPSELFREFLRC